MTMKTVKHDDWLLKKLQDGQAVSILFWEPLEHAEKRLKIGLSARSNFDGLHGCIQELKLSFAPRVREILEGMSQGRRHCCEA